MSEFGQWYSDLLDDLAAKALEAERREKDMANPDSIDYLMKQTDVAVKLRAIVAEMKNRDEEITDAMVISCLIAVAGAMAQQSTESGVRNAYKSAVTTTNKKVGGFGGS